jgi:DNA-binding CsgD family transcriptional regulator
MYYLTPAQYRVAARTAQGYTNRQIASALHLAPGTVNNTLDDIYKALELPHHMNQRVILALMYERGNIICRNPEEYYKTYRCKCVLVPV